MEDFLINITNSTKDYPSVITVFDDNYHIVAQSGSMVEIVEDDGAVSKYCYLDKYITDDISKKLLKAEYQYDVLADISYAEKDGEIIPGEISFNTYSDRQVQTVKFNDFAESKKSSGCYYALVDVDKNSFRHKNYEYLRNNMEEMVEKYGMLSSNHNGPSEIVHHFAVIENQCEFILENVNEEKNPAYVKSIYEESIRMTQLVNNMLKFNKLSTTDKIEKENTSLTDIVRSEIEKYSSFINARGHKVTADIEDVTINCNRELIQLAVDNFISNAVKHAPLNTLVKIKLIKEGNGCRFSVYNAADKPLTGEVWNSFYMGDKSRGGKSAGMGLAITKQILELHNYKYGFENKENGVEFHFIAK